MYNYNPLFVVIRFIKDSLTSYSDLFVGAAVPAGEEDNPTITVSVNEGRKLTADVPPVDPHPKTPDVFSMGFSLEVRHPHKDSNRTHLHTAGLAWQLMKVLVAFKTYSLPDPSYVPPDPLPDPPPPIPRIILTGVQIRTGPRTGTGEQDQVNIDTQKFNQRIDIQGLFEEQYAA